MEKSSSNHKTNKKIRIRKNYLKKSKIFEENKLEAFQTDDFIRTYLSRVINKSEFIRKAIYLYITYISNPEKIMKDLKFKYPDKYKAIGRRKYV